MVRARALEGRGAEGRAWCEPSFERALLAYCAAGCVCDCTPLDCCSGRRHADLIQMCNTMFLLMLGEFSWYEEQTLNGDSEVVVRLLGFVFLILASLLFVNFLTGLATDGEYAHPRPRAASCDRCL